MTEFTGSDVALIITAVGTFITSITAAIISAVNTIKINRASRKLDEVHNATNGMKEELVNVTGKEQRAVGVMEGRAQAHEEMKNGNQPH